MAARRAALVWAWLLCAWGCLPSHALAQTGAESPEPSKERLREVKAGTRLRSRKVILLPFREPPASAASLFSEDPRGPEQPLSAIESTVGRIIDADERVTWMSSEALRAELDQTRRVQAGAVLVRERYTLGKALYEDLRVADAINMLAGAERTASELFLEVVDPALVADIQLTLALCHLEAGRPELAHVALKRMFRYHPERRFPRGYYPPATEAAFVAALTDLAQSESRELVMDLDRIERLLAEVGADDVFSAQLRTSEQGHVIDLVVYSRKSRSFLYRGEVPIRFDDGDIERLDRAVSRWLACVPSEVTSGPSAASRGAFGTVLLDTSVAHGVYFGVPTREIFHNVGFSFNAAYAVRPELDIFGKVNLFTAFADPRQDLSTGTLTSVRTIIGAGVVFERGPWRGFVRPGIDLHYVSPFTVVNNSSCKFWGLEDPRCPQTSSAFRKVDSALLGGVNIATGVAVSLGRGLYITTQVSFSLYFALLESTDLNYLLGSELGLGYSF
jgi:hypothetical protein